MEVYVTHEKDGYGGERIARIFSTLEMAQDWVIENRFSADGLPRDAFVDDTKMYIEEHDLVTPNVELTGAKRPVE